MIIRFRWFKKWEEISRDLWEWHLKRLNSLSQPHYSYWTMSTITQHRCTILLWQTLHTRFSLTVGRATQLQTINERPVSFAKIDCVCCFLQTTTDGNNAAEYIDVFNHWPHMFIHMFNCEEISYISFELVNTILNVETDETNKKTWLRYDPTDKIGATNFDTISLHVYHYIYNFLNVKSSECTSTWFWVRHFR